MYVCMYVYEQKYKVHDLTKTILGTPVSETEIGRREVI